MNDGFREVYRSRSLQSVSYPKVSPLLIELWRSCARYPLSKEFIVKMTFTSSIVFDEEQMQQTLKGDCYTKSAKQCGIGIG
jgi:hypothetical protein